MSCPYSYSLAARLSSLSRAGAGSEVAHHSHGRTLDMHTSHPHLAPNGKEGHIVYIEHFLQNVQTIHQPHRVLLFSWVFSLDSTTTTTTAVYSGTSSRQPPVVTDHFIIRERHPSRPCPSASIQWRFCRLWLVTPRTRFYLV